MLRRSRTGIGPHSSQRPTPLPQGFLGPCRANSINGGSRRARRCRFGRRTSDSAGQSASSTRCSHALLGRTPRHSSAQGHVRVGESCTDESCKTLRPAGGRKRDVNNKTRRWCKKGVSGQRDRQCTLRPGGGAWLLKFAVATVRMRITFSSIRLPAYTAHPSVG